MAAHQEKSQTVKKLSSETNTEIPPVSTACGIMGTHTQGSPHPTRGRARETVVIGKSRPVVPKQLASVRLRAAFSDRASSSWSRDSDLDLVKLVPAAHVRL